mmetsp:Transcript_32015/g.77913  ORF Transcript_32015/g.77913 Transcript_32015/m.77913 type:complete len:206 (+) Transcript_32015:1658-2275(+)
MPPMIGMTKMAASSLCHRAVSATSSSSRRMNMPRRIGKCRMRTSPFLITKSVSRLTRMLISMSSTTQDWKILSRLPVPRSFNCVVTTLDVYWMEKHSVWMPQKSTCRIPPLNEQLQRFLMTTVVVEVEEHEVILTSRRGQDHHSTLWENATSSLPVGISSVMDLASRFRYVLKLVTSGPSFLPLRSVLVMTFLKWAVPDIITSMV